MASLRGVLRRGRQLAAFFGERWSLLKQLRHGGVITVSILIVVLLMVALSPAFMAIGIAALVHNITAEEPVMSALILLGAAVLLSRLGQVFSPVLSWRVTQLIDDARRQALVRMATSLLPYAELEDAHTQQEIRDAQADPQLWSERSPGVGAVAQLDLLLRWAGVAAAASLLAAYTWWLVPLVVLPIFLSRLIWRRQFVRHLAIDREGMLAGVEADQWREIAVGADPGKESRTFGLQDWAVERWQERTSTTVARKWRLGLKDVRDQWKIAVVVGVPILIAFTTIVLNGEAAHSIPEVAAVLATTRAALGLLGFIDALDIEGSIPGVRAFEKLQARKHSEVGPRSSRPSIGVLDAPRVQFEDVFFRYNSSARDVLKGLSFEIRPAEVLAVVGLNGAGKSTAIRLLAGLYAPNRGRITVDGIDMTDMAISDWHRGIALVFQDFIRYPLDVIDNITLGYAGTEPDRQLAKEAAAAAGLTEIIEALPNSWDTPLHRSREGGVDLSGGQWQKIVLARAVYAMRSGARLLVLDEPTAHLDVRAEFEVFHQLAHNKRQASVVLISHRLSTVRLADRILLLDGGMIVETGTHDELMSLRGKYADLFDSQADRFLEGALGDEEQSA